MTDMERHFRAGRETRSTGPIVIEYVIVLAVLILVGAVALAEATGMLGTLVHSISFTV